MSEQRRPAVPPGLPQAIQTPGYVSNVDQVVFRIFNGIDTKSPRPAIDERQMYWCDGLMPVGPSYLRLLPGIAPDNQTVADVSVLSLPANDPRTILWCQFGVIGVRPDPNLTTTVTGPRYYGVVLLSDGSVLAVNTDTGEIRPIMAPNTVKHPRSIFGFAQWAAQYFLFVNDQSHGDGFGDGYWIWDEHNTFTAGTFSPVITLTSSGDNYTSPPDISYQTTAFGFTGGSPVIFGDTSAIGGATFLATIDPNGDQVAKIDVTNPGSGFTVDDFVIMKFTGGGSDRTAWAQCILSPGGGVKEIVVTNGGQGYTFKAMLQITGGGGSGATAALNIQNGTIISVTILSPGSNYTSIPDLNLIDPGYTGVPGGSGAQGYPVIGLNGISEVVVIDGGSGYTDVPDVQIVGDGHGALFRARIGGGVVTDVQLVNPGESYSVALPLISGGNNAAEANDWMTLLFPFGWSGTTIEVYQERIWIANGAAIEDYPTRARLIWSAPGNPADASLGAGSAVSADSFIKVGWFVLKQSNGFLYLLGDSSVNNISNVQTTTTGQQPATATTPGNPGTTTTVFANQNTDPQSGTPWPSSVQMLNRNIIFANSYGIQISYGGAVQKVSPVLDGIFPVSTDIYDRHADFSSAVAQIFGIQVYCLLIPILDLYTGQVVKKLVMFDQQKFWTSNQDVPLTYIASQEILSQMVAWGSDGKNLFRLFQHPNTKFLKVVRSKFWDAPGYDWNKTGVRLYGIFQDFPLDRPVFVDIESSATSGGQPWSFPGSPGFAGAYNGQFYTVELNPTDPGMQLNATAVWGPYPVGQQGRLAGITLRTNASSGNLVSLLLRQQDIVLNE